MDHWRKLLKDVIAMASGVPMAESLAALRRIKTHLAVHVSDSDAPAEEPRAQTGGRNRMQQGGPDRTKE